MSGPPSSPREAEGGDAAPPRRDEHVKGFHKNNHYHSDEPPSRRGGEAVGAGVGERKSFVGKVLGCLFAGSSTTVRVDMQRPGFVREQRSKDYNGWGDGYGGGGGGDGSGSQRHNFRVEQTRVKIMQKWEGGVFSQRQVGGGSERKSRVDLGVGLDVSLMEADVVPELRLRLRTANSDNAPNLYLRVLPRQELVGRTRVPILNTGLFLGLRLQVPLASIGDVGSYLRGGGRDEFRSGGAQPMITAQLLRPAGTGAHLSTSGLEFDEKILRLGPDCALRLAASVDFPREYPLPEIDEGPLRLKIKKLGVKKCFRWCKDRRTT